MKNGRNAPCPCGSNKKYKQCCLPRKEALPEGFPPVRAAAVNASEAFQSALRHHEAGRLIQAEAGYRQVLRLEPDHADALHLFGILAQQAGDGELAVELIGRAIRVNPRNPFFHGDMGNVLQVRGRLDEACAHYRSALALRPNLAEVHSNLGKALQEQGLLDEAIASYRTALAHNPGLPETLSNLGNALLAQGKPGEAIASYRTALGIAPDFAEAHYNLANALLAQGDHDEAVAGYRSALAIKPELIQAHVNLGNALRNQGKSDEAAICYHRALALKPDLVQAHINLGSTLLDQGDPEGAAGAYRVALELAPESTQVLINLGNALREQGRQEEAIACYRRVIEIDPENIIASHILAALTGGNSACAPREYVTYLFDGIAGTFDVHLLGNLNYTVPEELVRLIREFSPPPHEKWDVLDLGCGTGLVGAAIAPCAGKLVGVDLSPRMVAKARGRNVYQRVVLADVSEMMQTEQPGSYDVVTAADLFIYLGDLDGVLGGVKRVLRSGGLFGFSLERLDGPTDFKLLPTTRYAHSSAYVARLAGEHRFSIHRMVSTHLRLEQGTPVPGWLVLLGADRTDGLS